MIALFRSLFVSTSAVCLAGAATADVLVVPDAYGTITAAVTAASDGDVILLRPGRYKGASNRNVNLLGKALTIRGEKGPLRTTLDPEAALASQQRIFFQGSASGLTTFEGLTFANGHYGGGLDGGAVSITNSDVVFKDCRFLGNRCEDNGGAVAIVDSDATFETCTFEGNASEDTGGGLYFSGTSNTLTVRDCEFRANRAFSGGGLYAHGSGTVARTTLDSNQAIELGNFPASTTYRGGGVFFDQGDWTLRRSYVTNNYTEIWGGGIHFDSQLGASLSIQDTVIANNYAGTQGSALFLTGSNADLDLTNVTVAGNVLPAGSFVHSIFINSTTSDVEIHNSILYDNFDDGDLFINTGNTSLITYSNIEDGSGSLNVAPQFVDALAGDYRLKKSSPCVDAGDGNRASKQDIDGKRRFDVNSTPNTGAGAPAFTDLGAHEFGGAGRRALPAIPH